MENSQQLPDDFLELCRSITAKRPKTVIDHILQHGFITTEELKETYGYNHAPRAARDVRENGIPLETFYVTGNDGLQKISCYFVALLTGLNLGHANIAKTGTALRISLFVYPVTGRIQKAMSI